jgi:hypothetical protein
VKNQRIKEKPIIPFTEDWIVVDPVDAEFAFRVWGGSLETCLTVHEDLTFPLSLSRSSFLYIKSNKEGVLEVFKNFNKERLLKSKIGSAGNVGGNIYTETEIVVEYNLTKEYLKSKN